MNKFEIISEENSQIDQAQQEINPLNVSVFKAADSSKESFDSNLNSKLSKMFSEKDSNKESVDLGT